MTAIPRTARWMTALAVAVGVSACNADFPFMPGTASEPATSSGRGAPGEAHAVRDVLDRARAARAAGENEVAVRQYRAAIVATQGEEQASIRIELGEMLLLMGRRDEAYSTLVDAVDRAERGKDPEARVRAYVALGHALQRLNRYSDIPRPC
jgi:tetratricopeptide (TPR) repeat protein